VPFDPARTPAEMAPTMALHQKFRCADLIDLLHRQKRLMNCSEQILVTQLSDYLWFKLAAKET
jgi:hypothetical protein